MKRKVNDIFYYSYSLFGLCCILSHSNYSKKRILYFQNENYLAKLTIRTKGREYHEITNLLKKEKFENISWMLFVKTKSKNEQIWQERESFNFNRIN